jgi:hypothetical protein
VTVLHNMYNQLMKQSSSWKADSTHFS